MGVHLHHLTAVALTVPKRRPPRLGPAPQGAHHQPPKPLPGEVLPPHAAAADGAPLAQVARRDLALRPTVALTLPDCTSIGPPRLHQRQNGQAAKSLAGKVIRHAGGQTAAAFTPPERSPPVVAWCCRPQSHRHSHTRCPPCRWGQHPPPPGRWKRCPVRSWRWAAWAWFLAWVTSRRRQPQLWVIPRRRLVPRVVIPPRTGRCSGTRLPGLSRRPAPAPVPPPSAGQRSFLPWELWPWSPCPPLFLWASPSTGKANPGPCLRKKNPGISWDTRDSRIFNMVTRRGIRTPDTLLKRQVLCQLS